METFEKDLLDVVKSGIKQDLFDIKQHPNNTFKLEWGEATYILIIIDRIISVRLMLSDGTQTSVLKEVQGDSEIEDLLLKITNIYKYNLIKDTLGHLKRLNNYLMIVN